MSSDSVEKGKILEGLVRALENVRIGNLKALPHISKSIEQNKRICVSGVQHEIDLWVELELSEQYKLIQIFECKNTKKKVDKIIVSSFCDKIKDVNAAEGYIVSYGFTKSAIARADQDKRCHLITVAKKSSPIQTSFVKNYISSIHVDFPKNITQMISIEKIENARIVFDGKQKTYKEYVESIRELAKTQAEKDSEKYLENNQPFSEMKIACKKKLEVKNGLFINDTPVPELELEIQYELELSLPEQIQYYFQERGTVIPMGRLDKFHGVSASIDLVFPEK